MSDSKIEWTRNEDGSPGKTWNPLRGCSKVSEGCRSCYAIRQAHRFAGEGRPYEGLTQAGPGGPNWTGKVMLVPEMLNAPLRWRKSQRVFVNSMSDLFHPEVPFDFIDQVFAVMALTPQHTFMILTKRPERMLEYFTTTGCIDKLGDLSPWMEQWGWISPEDAANIAPPGSTLPKWPAWPLPNVWLGVSIENQKAADERIPLLLQTPATVRFLSCEPLLGPVDLTSISLPGGVYWDALDKEEAADAALEGDCSAVIDWVIAGGESGTGARPAHPDWFRSMRDQCQAAGVAFFFKQWGEWAPGENFPNHIPSGTAYEWSDGDDDNAAMWKVGKQTAGRLLDGKEWSEFPNVRK